MGKEFSEDVITLIDDEGVEREFEILDSIENENGSFYALIPNFELPGETSEEEDVYFIFESIQEDGEERLVEVEDDELLEELAGVFEDRFEEPYEDEEG